MMRYFFWSYVCCFNSKHDSTSFFGDVFLFDHQWKKNKLGPKTSLWYASFYLKFLRRSCICRYKLPPISFLRFQYFMNHPSKTVFSNLSNIVFWSEVSTSFWRSMEQAYHVLFLSVSFLICTVTALIASTQDLLDLYPDWNVRMFWFWRNQTIRSWNSPKTFPIELNRLIDVIFERSDLSPYSCKRIIFAVSKRVI